MQNRVSVIMLTYNREELVPDAIEAVLKQTMSDFEYIIVDNGSSDRSGQIADEYAGKDSRIRVLHIPKSNIGTGRNAGLDVATGEYITFIDDDDIIEPEMLQFLYQLAVDTDADVSICGTNLKHYDEHLVMETEEAVVKLLERKYYNVGFPTKMIKASLFEKNRFSKEGKYDDIYLMPKIIAASKRVAYHGKPYYIENRHENNNSSWTTNHKLITKEILQEYLDVYRDRTEWLTELFPERGVAWSYFEWSFMISMVNKIETYELEECYDIEKKLVQVLKQNSFAFLNCDYIQDFEREWMRQYIG